MHLTLQSRLKAFCGSIHANKPHINLRIALFVYFVALRPKSTAKVMAGRSVHLTTLFPGQA